jgi:aspartyl-tRNA(Asn)/glutamyl-tRNA(Gln) amidotransferase subunit B
MRSKETEADYRYFREPDLLPIRLSQEWRSSILKNLPELPLERRARFQTEYGLPAYDAEILTEERSLSDYFEVAIAAFGGDPKVVSNWMMNDVLRMIRERGVTAGDLRLRPAFLAEIIRLVQSKSITTTTGKELLGKVEATGQTPEQIVEAEGLSKVSDEGELRRLAEDVVRENPDQVAAYRNGKTSLIGWFVGQIMRKTGGKADPQRTRVLLEGLLSERS